MGAVAVGACVVDGGACVRLCEGARCACWRALTACVCAAS